MENYTRSFGLVARSDKMILCNHDFETNMIIAYSSGTLCTDFPLILFINEP